MPHYQHDPTDSTRNSDCRNADLRNNAAMAVWLCRILGMNDGLHSATVTHDTHESGTWTRGEQSWMRLRVLVNTAWRERCTRWRTRRAALRAGMNEWNQMFENEMEWNGMQWMECKEKKRINEMEWNGIGVKCNVMKWNEWMEWNGWMDGMHEWLIVWIDWMNEMNGWKRWKW